MLSPTYRLLLCAFAALAAHAIGYLLGWDRGWRAGLDSARPSDELLQDAYERGGIAAVQIDRQRRAREIPIPIPLRPQLHLIVPERPSEIAARIAEQLATYPPRRPPAPPEDDSGGAA